LNVLSNRLKISRNSFAYSFGFLKMANNKRIDR